MSPPGLGGLGSPPPAGSTANPSQSRLEASPKPQGNGLGGLGSSSTPASAPSSLGSFDSAPPPPTPSQAPAQNTRPLAHDKPSPSEVRRPVITDRFSSGNEMDRAGRGESFPANLRNSRLEIQSVREWVRFGQRLETFLGQTEMNARVLTAEHPAFGSVAEGEGLRPFLSSLASLSGNLFSRSSSMIGGLLQGLSQLLGGRLPAVEIKDGHAAVMKPPLPASTPKEGPTAPRENVVSSRTPEVSKETFTALSTFSQKWMAQLQAALASQASPQALIRLLSSDEGLRALALPPEQLKALYETLSKSFPNAFKPLTASPPGELPYPLILKNLIQGMVYLVALPGMANLASALSPVWRLLFGNLLFQKAEVDLHHYHSVLLDELGALMARRTRRVRRRERKKISRADRVMAKDHSLPIDTHSQGEEDGPDEFDFLKEPPPNKDVSSFLWH